MPVKFGNKTCSTSLLSSSCCGSVHVGRLEKDCQNIHDTLQGTVFFFRYLILYCKLGQNETNIMDTLRFRLYIARNTESAIKQKTCINNNNNNNNNNNALLLTS